MVGSALIRIVNLRTAFRIVQDAVHWARATDWDRQRKNARGRGRFFPSTWPPGVEGAFPEYLAHTSDHEPGHKR